MVVDEYSKFKLRHPLDIIKEELEEMQSNPSDDFKCLALTGNFYDWQFAIRGLNGTEFEGGIYHGRNQFSEEYPSKRPVFTLLTENGCFKTQTDISFFLFCREQSTVRDALHRLIESLPNYPDGALGSVRYDKEERRALAIKSREAPPTYGTAERQKLINEIHECMLSKAPPVPSNRGGDIRLSSQNDRDKRKLGKSIHFLIAGNTINANNFNQVGIFEQNQMHMTATSAAKDIEKELKEMQSNPSDDFKCIALEGNIYDWQIAIRGPNGTEFEGGIYHSRIQFPKEYPHKRPRFMLLTENGRFQTRTEIWFPWHTLNVRDTLHRLIELLPTYPDGALGSVRFDKEERRALAIKSREAPPRYGTAQRQKLIDEIHECMLSKAPHVPSNRGGDIRLSSQNGRDKRTLGKIFQFLIGITLNAKQPGRETSSNQVGIFNFDKSLKKAKQDVSSRETSSNHVGIFDFDKSIQDVSIRETSAKHVGIFDFDKSIQDVSIRETSAKHVGIFDFGKSLKKAKQDVSSRETSSTSIEDNQE